MRQFIDRHVIANQVRMRGNRVRGQTVLIVEGDKDVRLFGNFVDSARCRIVPGHGKDNVVGALDILDKEHWKGVLGIVDTDFDWLDGGQPALPNLFYTDTHDIETMLLNSGALDKVLREWDLSMDAFGPRLLSAVIEAGKVVGYFRWISLRENRRLTFDGLDFEDFIDMRSLTVDVKKLVSSVTTRSRCCVGRWEDLSAAIQALHSPAHDVWLVCCGHDLVAILSLVLEKKHGRRLHPDTIESNLRLAYEFTHFRMTRLYASLSAWEKTNQPFVLFRVIQ